MEARLGAAAQVRAAAIPVVAPVAPAPVAKVIVKTPIVPPSGSSEDSEVEPDGDGWASAPGGPRDEEESGYLAEPPDDDWGNGSTRQGGSIEVEPEAPLPGLDDLTKRISPKVMTAIDELFRAKFSKVQRVPKKCLKS